ncbi:MAG: hypothetical protein ACXWUM_07220 [Burkholderiaceae bacterium]
MAGNLVEVPAAIIEGALEMELHDGEVIADTVDERPCIFLAGLHRAERAIAGRLRTLASGSLPWPAIDADKSHTVGREQSRRHPRREPARGGAAGTAIEGPRHHRRSRCQQDTLVNSILKILMVKGVNSAWCSTDASRSYFPWPTPGLSHLAFKPPLDQVLVADCFALALLVGERRFRRARPV